MVGSESRKPSCGSASHPPGDLLHTKVMALCCGPLSAAQCSPSHPFSPGHSQASTAAARLMSAVLVYTTTRLSQLVGVTLGFYMHRASPIIHYLTQTVKCPKCLWLISVVALTIAKPVDENS